MRLREKWLLYSSLATYKTLSSNLSYVGYPSIRQITWAAAVVK